MTKYQSHQTLSSYELSYPPKLTQNIESATAGMAFVQKIHKIMNQIQATLPSRIMIFIYTLYRRNTKKIHQSNWHLWSISTQEQNLTFHSLMIWQDIDFKIISNTYEMKIQDLKCFPSVTKDSRNNKNIIQIKKL